MTLPASSQPPAPVPPERSKPSPADGIPHIGAVTLPVARAEELLQTLPGVISARIMIDPSQGGLVDEIHVLTTTEVTPKQTVRNIESALIAHLGFRVSHKKISVATSEDPVQKAQRASGQVVAPQGAWEPPAPTATPTMSPPGGVLRTSGAATPRGMLAVPAGAAVPRRRIYFEDVEVRRSRTKGVACRVTLRKGEQTFIGEAEGVENERLRVELAARAALAAIRQAEVEGGAEEPPLGLEGCKVIEAFERTFVFVGITARAGRDNALMTGSAEVKESPETASVLAVLDATNRWLDLMRL